MEDVCNKNHVLQKKVRIIKTDWVEWPVDSSAFRTPGKLTTTLRLLSMGRRQKSS